MDDADMWPECIKTASAAHANVLTVFQMLGVLMKVYQSTYHHLELVSC